MLDLLRLNVLIACITGLILDTSAILRDPSISVNCDLRQNETEIWDVVLHSNCQRKSMGCLIKREADWIDNIKSHHRHFSFYINLMQREYQYLSNASPDVLDRKRYVGTPKSLFSLLKRATRDWPKAPRLMSSLPGTFNLYGNRSKFSKLNHQFKKYLPKLVDLRSAYRALSRLQRVYNLTTTSVADFGTTTSRDSAFSASDFLQAASYFCSERSFHQCTEWLDKAIVHIRGSSYLPDISAEEFIELYFISNCMNGHQNISKIFYQTLLEENPDFSPSSKFNAYYEKIVGYGCDNAKAKIVGKQKYKSKTLNPVKGGPKNRYIAYQIDPDDPGLLELCNHRAVYAPTAHLLKCRYVHYNNPYLSIGPFKMEEFHIDPPVLVFHDVIGDKEIQEMVKFGKRYMYQAPVYWEDGDEKITFDFRTSAHFWINDWFLPVASVLSRRAALMTGWDLVKSHPNQIASYGPAGEFKPHMDTMTEDADKDNQLYGVYSVIMYYIGDVAEGGQTIFPALNVTLSPKKYSAAMWYNIGPDGHADKKSLHASCPVRQGQKWVINKWFHRDLQDFPKCTDQKETSFRYFYL